MRAFGLVFWWVAIVSVLGILVLTLNYIAPPFTDISKVLFFNAQGYLPPKEVLSRDEIAPALDKILDYERRNYIRIFYLTIAALVGMIGVGITRRADRKSKEPVS